MGCLVFRQCSWRMGFCSLHRQSAKCLYRQTTKKEKMTIKSTLVDIMEESVFLRTIKGLVLLLAFAMIASFFISSAFAVVFPFFCKRSGWIFQQAVWFLAA